LCTNDQAAALLIGVPDEDHITVADSWSVERVANPAGKAWSPLSTSRATGKSVIASVYDPDASVSRTHPSGP
jgi:hypothetical protein